MPVYLCRPGGEGEVEPWKHVVQVYAEPYEEESEAPVRESNSGLTIRRVRHAEVLLVDAVFIKYDRYWLRLVFPESHEYAGCIALGKVDGNGGNSGSNSGSSGSPCLESTNTDHLWLLQVMRADVLHAVLGSEDCISILNKKRRYWLTECSNPQTYNMTKEEFAKVWRRVQHSVSQETSADMLLCQETGLYFPTSPVLQLLPQYDDGLNKSKKHLASNRSTIDDEGAETDVDGDLEEEDDALLLDQLHLVGVEPVFCRICREGVHDLEWDGGLQGTSAQPPLLPPPHTKETIDLPRLQKLVASHPSVENPFIAPCKCTGSMAFVHYLCIEQWRARSRHPDAHLGTHCETCKSPYSLPPPTLDYVPPRNEDDAWLEAMPPHVLQALRRPHIWWQVGVAIVRRPYLRPLAPILLSPLVAIYCRARRTLKKRGVSRRRWSCSLCRRRARWKCVRCLHSYYCSRQCQNVSWHILHKHVC